jgi:hypothetical protein
MNMTLQQAFDAWKREHSLELHPYKVKAIEANLAKILKRFPPEREMKKIMEWEWIEFQADIYINGGGAAAWRPIGEVLNLLFAASEVLPPKWPGRPATAYWKRKKAAEEAAEHAKWTKRAPDETDYDKLVEDQMPPGWGDTKVG